MNHFDVLFFDLFFMLVTPQYLEEEKEYEVLGYIQTCKLF